MQALQKNKPFTPLVQSFAMTKKKPEYFYSGFRLNDQNCVKIEFKTYFLHHAAYQAVKSMINNKINKYKFKIPHLIPYTYWCFAI